MHLSPNSNPFSEFSELSLADFRAELQSDSSLNSPRAPTCCTAPLEQRLRGLLIDKKIKRRGFETLDTFSEKISDSDGNQVGPR